MSRTERREQLRSIAERLTDECAGEVPPGRVIALVFRAHHALASSCAADEEYWLRACEAAARAALLRWTTPSSSGRIASLRTMPPRRGLPRADQAPRSAQPLAG